LRHVLIDFARASIIHNNNKKVFQFPEGGNQPFIHAPNNISYGILGLELLGYKLDHISPYTYERV
jgi:hypothetical protein